MKKNLDIEISAIPFSRFGSYLAFSLLAGKKYADKGIPNGIWLRCIHGDVVKYEVMQFELIENGESVSFDINCTASTLSLKSKSGSVDICLPSPDTVRIRVKGTTLRITAPTFRNHHAIPEPDGNWILNLASSFRSYRMVPLNGDFKVDAPWEVKRCKHIISELSANGGENAELAIEIITWARPQMQHSESFDFLAENVQQEFNTFSKPLMEKCPDNLQNTAVKAAYLDWSSFVHPNGLLQRPTMYMSKNWMTNVWAWDHAFNALAVSLTDPDLAWDQIMIIFDHQNENGQIPDFTNDRRLLTCFVKPPIHGWIISLMIKFSGELPHERIKEAYDKLSKWTDWWFNFRDPEGDGLPVYWHGNDSGWDNGTVFDVPLPLKSADLAAFLIIQMDLLANFAEKLGRNTEAENWQKRSEKTLTTLIEKLWNGIKFRSLSTVTDQVVDLSDSVFSCLPIVLGKRLPCEIRKKLIEDIRRHITEWGPATEHPDSPLYENDGYWRGPIWAPPTIILVDGLISAGEKEMATDIAKRFCKLCEKSGFAENFDAITGDPQCDPAYTWTSSVFLVLANKYLDI